MINHELDLLAYLDRQGIPYMRSEHPPVYTCEQADALRPDLPGVSTKNLFLRDRAGRNYLVMTACEKQLDLKELGRVLGASKLHFGDEDRLLALLGVTPGAVTVLGLVNDERCQVKLLIDEEIWDGTHFLCHPLVNTATLVLSKADLERFFTLTGHTPSIVPVPARCGDSRWNKIH